MSLLVAVDGDALMRMPMMWGGRILSIVSSSPGHLGAILSLGQSPSVPCCSHHCLLLGPLWKNLVGSLEDISLSQQ